MIYNNRLAMACQNAKIGNRRSIQQQNLPQVAPVVEDEKDGRLIINSCNTIYDVVGNSAKRFGFRECKEDPGL